MTLNTCLVFNVITPCVQATAFVALAVCFGSLSCWNTHPWHIFNALALTAHGTVHHPLEAVQLSCPFSRKTPLKHNVSTSMFDGGDGILGAAFLLLQTRWVEWIPKSWILVSSNHNTFTVLLSIIGKLCSSGLIPRRSHDHWNSTRWYLAWSPSPREIDSCFVFHPFANNRTNCCHLLNKLLGDGLVENVLNQQGINFFFRDDS